MDLSRTPWRKASYSNSNGGACVEVAATRHAVAVRDSKDADGPSLVFPARDWAAFLDQIKHPQPHPS